MLDIIFASKEFYIKLDCSLWW